MAVDQRGALGERASFYLDAVVTLPRGANGTRIKGAVVVDRGHLFELCGHM